MIPEENVKDLSEIPDNVKSGLEIIPVARMDEVLKGALTRKLQPITWEEDASETPPPQAPGGEEGIRAH
jgi:ATP-dependent Lon protease